MRQRSLFRVTVTIYDRTKDSSRLYHYIINAYLISHAIDDVLGSLKLDGFMPNDYEWRDIHATKLSRQTGIVASY